jgi:hypothetical protein
MGALTAYSGCYHHPLEFLAFQAKIRLASKHAGCCPASHMRARLFVVCETQAVGTSLGR